MYFAETTGIWESRDAEIIKSVVAPEYDMEKLLRYLVGFVEERRQWKQFFTYYNISPLIINYEDAINCYPKYLNPLLELTGLNTVQPLPLRRMFKIGNDLNASFSERLRREVHSIYGSDYIPI